MIEYTLRAVVCRHEISGPRGLHRDRDRVLNSVTCLGQQLEQASIALGVIADRALAD
ncbi:MAG: hypothetical protein ACRDQA_11235 [Nocardioidaceae bacterium]